MKNIYFKQILLHPPQVKEVRKNQALPIEICEMNPVIVAVLPYLF
jgi:hypothetical protein